MEKSIQTRNLTKHFGKTCAVNALNLEVPSGSIFGFLGSNGAGKTTTLKLLLGLLKPSEGNSVVLDFDSWKNGDSLRKRTGVLFEEHGLYPWLTGPENMNVFGRLLALSAQTILQRTQKLKKTFQLFEEESAKPVSKLSRGIQQKWGLVRAFLSNPNVLFLDEPTAGLDPISAKEVRNEIVSFVQKEGTTVFLNTHNLDEALRLCSKVAVIHRGQLVACGDPQNLHSDAKEYLIHYGGSPVNENSLPAPVHFISEKEGLLRVKARDKKDIAALVQTLVSRQNDVYGVCEAQNPLERIFSDLNAGQSKGNA